MPEDQNPALPLDSAENYAYFTLPMALNYQRNAYTLWQSAQQTYADPATRDIFTPAAAAAMPTDTLRQKLLKHKLALQPNKQPVIWQTLCTSFTAHFQGDIRTLFSGHNHSVQAIKQYITTHKKAFPYLGGDKILNYWLYVMQAYTDLTYPDRHLITVAPDTHVIQASVRLGLLTPEEAARPDVRPLTAARWSALLSGTTLSPIDVHTPLWLWSRGKFTAQL